MILSRALSMTEKSSPAYYNVVSLLKSVTNRLPYLPANDNSSNIKQCLSDRFLDQIFFAQNAGNEYKNGIHTDDCRVLATKVRNSHMCYIIFVVVGLTQDITVLKMYGRQVCTFFLFKENSSSSTGPLSGYRVLDLSRYV